MPVEGWMVMSKDAGGEASAEGGFFDGDGKCGSGLMRRQCHVDRLEFRPVDDGRLAGDTVVIHGVDAVGGDVHLEEGAVCVQIEHAFDGDAAESEIIGKMAVSRSEAGEIFAEPGGENLHEI